MSLVRRILFSENNEKYSEIFSDAISCMDVLEPIFLVMENMCIAFDK